MLDVAECCRKFGFERKDTGGIRSLMNGRYSQLQFEDLVLMCGS